MLYALGKAQEICFSFLAAPADQAPCETGQWAGHRRQAWAWKALALTALQYRQRVSMGAGES